MIYTVKLNGIDIYQDYPDMMLVNPHLEMEVNTAGSFEFTLPPNHVFYDKIEPLISDIEVYEAGALLWFGRPIEIRTDIYKQKIVYCEGALAYLNDSVQQMEAWEYNDISLHSFFKLVISYHNYMVDANRQFAVGDITVTDRPVYRKLEYNGTLDVIRTMCLDTDGGYLFVRKQNGKMYIDWLKDMPYTVNQPAEFTLNLADLNKNINGSDIVTCCIPLGANMTWYEDGDPGKPYDSGYPLTLTGMTFIDNDGENDRIISEAATLYGQITRVVRFPEIDDQDDLYDAGVEYLESTQFAELSIECDAVDLHYVNGLYQPFRIGQTVHVVSSPHLVNVDLPLYKMSLNLDSGVKKITLGTPKRQTLTDITKQRIDAIQNEVDDVEDWIDFDDDLYDEDDPTDTLENKLKDTDYNPSPSIPIQGEDGNDYSIGVDDNGDLTTSLIPKSIRFSASKTEYYVGDALHYSDFEVEAVYGDGSTEDITSECHFRCILANNGIFTTEGNFGFEAVWEKAGKQYKTRTTLKVTSAFRFTKTHELYPVGDTFHISDFEVKYGVTDVTSECTYNIQDNTRLNTIGTQTLTATYVHDGETLTTSTTFAVGCAQEPPLVNGVYQYEGTVTTYFIHPESVPVPGAYTYIEYQLKPSIYKAAAIIDDTSVFYSDPECTKLGLEWKIIFFLNKDEEYSHSGEPVHTTSGYGMYRDGRDFVVDYWTQLVYSDIYYNPPMPELGYGLTTFTNNCNIPVFKDEYAAMQYCKSGFNFGGGGTSF